MQPNAALCFHVLLHGWVGMGSPPMPAHLALLQDSGTGTFPGLDLQLGQDDAVVPAWLEHKDNAVPVPIVPYREEGKGPLLQPGPVQPPLPVIQPLGSGSATPTSHRHSGAELAPLLCQPHSGGDQHRDGEHQRGLPIPCRALRAPAGCERGGAGQDWPRCQRPALPLVGTHRARCLAPQCLSPQH